MILHVADLQSGDYSQEEVLWITIIIKDYLVIIDTLVVFIIINALGSGILRVRRRANYSARI